MRLVLAVAACLVTLSARGAVSGRIKIDAATYDAGAHTIEQSLGFRTSSQLSGQLRIAASREYARWRLEGAVQLDTRNGSAVARDRRLPGGEPGRRRSASAPCPGGLGTRTGIGTASLGYRLLESPNHVCRWRPNAKHRAHRSARAVLDGRPTGATGRPAGVDLG